MALEISLSTERHWHFERFHYLAHTCTATPDMPRWKRIGSVDHSPRFDQLVNCPEKQERQKKYGYYHQWSALLEETAGHRGPARRPSLFTQASVEELEWDVPVDGLGAPYTDNDCTKAQRDNVERSSTCQVGRPCSVAWQRW